MLYFSPYCLLYKCHVLFVNVLQWWIVLMDSLIKVRQMIAFTKQVTEMDPNFHIHPAVAPLSNWERTIDIHWMTHSYPQSIPLLNKWPQGETHVRMVSGHPWARGKCQPNQRGPVFWENVIFSAQGAPRKSWGTYFYVKSKNKWGLLSSFF